MGACACDKCVSACRRDPGRLVPADLKKIAALLAIGEDELKKEFLVIVPARSGGNIRLFSERDVLRLRAITLLTANLGVNLAGVEMILDLRRTVEALQAQVDALQGDLRAIRGYLLEDHRRRAPDEAPVPPRAGARRRRSDAAATRSPAEPPSRA